MGLKGKPLTTAPYPTAYRPGHPVAHADGRVRIHRAALYDRIGPGEHPCHWCARPVTWEVHRGSRALVADHVNRDTWDNSPQNLVPACNGCNASRHLSQRDICGHGHLWTPETTYYRPDGGGRQCRICNRATEARRVRHR